MVRKKVSNLLVAGMFAESLLSGCGNKDTDSRVEEAVNDLGWL